MTKNKLRVAVIFGGRSGEHEVSLMSARSVLSVLDPGKYDLIQIGITREGKWLTGEDVLGKFEHEDNADLKPVMASSDPSEPGLYAVDGRQMEKMSDVDVYFPLLH